MNSGRKFLSDLKLHSDFLGWNEKKQRYETWEEACVEVFDTHRVKYEHLITPELTKEINFAEKLYKTKHFLTAQRALQFRGEDMFKHNFKMFNCLVMFADKPSFLGNAFYLMLCGCGVGVNMMLPFTERLPDIQKRTKGTKTYIVEDSIQGWGEAAHVLVSSYISTNPVEGFENYQGYEIKFDFSQLRPQGAKVGTKYKAPGPKGIKTSFEKIEALLESYVTKEAKTFKGIIAYDIFMHLADAVLSGGIRRAACSIIVSPEDDDMILAKSGNWFSENRQRGRSNNSVGLLRGEFSQEEFQQLLEMNQGTSDIGFVFLNHIFEVLNPCFEIGFTPLHFNFDDKSIVDRVLKSDVTLLDEPGFKTAIQCCNLTEIDGSQMDDEKTFYKTCRAAAITGTLQAGYTDFKYIKDVLQETKIISERESLLGVSITGWANNPWLFNETVLEKGAQIIKSTNELVAGLLGINPSARNTTVKPSGNASVILGCASGIHAEHSENYFRVMQLNKDTETGKWISANASYLIEEGVYSETQTDYAVFVPIKNNPGTMYKDDLKGIKHLELIKLVKEHWVDAGKTEDRCIIPTTSHNVSNTVIIDDFQAITDYVFENQFTFTAVSFLGEFGDKDYNQSPNTSVLSFEQIFDKYGEGALFASGLIVDGLHYFNNNLWKACEHIMNREEQLVGTREQVLLQKYWVSRAKKFSKNYFKRNHQNMIYCLKDIHLLHKWKEINREFKEVNLTEILTKPTYTSVDTMGAAACSGGSCEITRID
jgi:ribonucleoside-triphosphate reductase (thioredoxin)